MAKNHRITIAEAKRQAADWEAEHEQHQRTAAIARRFQGSSASEVITMWETGKNEHGRKLTQFEFTSLIERWCDLFGTLPPDDDEALNGLAGDQTTTPEPNRKTTPCCGCGMWFA